MSQISVVLPCLNEEKGLPVCVGKIREVFRAYELDGEIIVVDNNSSDNTSEIAKNLGVEVVFEGNRGYGNAYKKGFKSAKGEFVFLGDADNSYDFYDIPRFLEVLNTGADFVIGNRASVMKGSSPFLHQHIGRPFFSAVLRRLFDLKISDSHCGFGVIRKSALDSLNLKSSGMEFASEILIKAKKNNLNIQEIPITYHKRFGKSKLRTFRDGFRHIYLISKEFFNR